MRRDRKSAVRDEATEAQFVIAQFGAWVVNADTKAGLLATATTVLGGVLAGQRTAIRAAFPLNGWRDWAQTGAVITTLVAVLTAVAALVAALRPRIRDDTRSRYSWPAVADMPVDELLARCRRGSTAEAWRAAHGIAVIARQKFRWLRLALLAWAGGAVGLLAWFLLSP